MKPFLAFSTRLVPARRRPALFASVALLALAAHPGAVHADVRHVRADSFELQFVEVIHAPPTRVYSAFGEIGRWWNLEHSYSHDGANWALSMEAGGCLCERFSEGSVEHGRVLMALHDQILRLDAPLGPLQGLAVKAILTFQLKPVGGATQLTTSYLVNGSSTSQLTGFAAPVNQVLADQLTRFKSYVETGSPAAAPAEPAPK